MYISIEGGESGQPSTTGRERNDQTLPYKDTCQEDKIDALFDSGSQETLIVADLVKNLGLEVRDHPNPYPLGWVHKDAKLKVKKQCKIRFAINADFIDEVDLDVVPLDVCGVVFGSPYMYMRDAIVMRRANQYCLIKDRKSFIVNTYKGK